MIKEKDCNGKKHQKAIRMHNKKIKKSKGVEGVVDIKTVIITQLIKVIDIIDVICTRFRSAKRLITRTFVLLSSENSGAMADHLLHHGRHLRVWNYFLLRVRTDLTAALGRSGARGHGGGPPPQRC